MKHTLKPGWTKAKVMEQFKKRNNGTRASAPNTNCAYRGDGGNACAAGAFIPDALYVPCMEGVLIYNLLANRPELEEFMPLEMEGMLDMQQSHDGCRDTDSTYEAIQKFLDKRVVEGATE